MGTAPSRHRWAGALGLVLSVACVENNPLFDPSAVSGSGGSGGSSTASSTGDDSGVIEGSGGGTGESTCPPGMVCLDEGQRWISHFEVRDVGTDDFDGDGAVDVLVAYEGGAIVAFGAGDGEVDEVRKLDEGIIAVRVTAGDFDGDGDVEPVYSLNTDTSFIVHDNLGGRIFSAEQPVPAGSTQQGITALDGDGDGMLDIAYTRTNSGEVLFELGNGTGTFAGSPLLTTTEPMELYAADFDGDGGDDLAIVHGGPMAIDSGLTVARSLLAGPTVDELLQGTEPVAVDGDDFDGDGTLDLVVVTRAPRLELLRGQGDGTFAPGSGIDLMEQPTDVAAGDVDGDGNRDVVITLDAAALAIVRGDGVDGLTLSRFEAPPEVFAVDCADVDGNGRDDVVLGVGSFDEGGITVLRSL